MTIKITNDECCKPAFEPYTLTLHVDNYDDHITLKYLSMCSTVVPDALFRKAGESVNGRYRDCAGSIRSRSKAFLIALAGKIPRRVGSNG